MERHVKLFARLSDPLDRLIHRISHPSKEQTLVEPNFSCFICIWVHGCSVCNPQFCKKNSMVPMIFPKNLVESRKTGYKPVDFTANRLTMPYICDHCREVFAVNWSLEKTIPLSPLNNTCPLLLMLQHSLHQPSLQSCRPLLLPCS